VTVPLPLPDAVTETQNGISLLTVRGQPGVNVTAMLPDPVLEL